MIQMYYDAYSLMEMNIWMEFGIPVLMAHASEHSLARGKAELMLNLNAYWNVLYRS